ncbi:MAG: hypothetical protein NDI94_01115 [Candidatus Woesearchaeota archaeon]|nr:hypothetical protein [Candidatus Woesearchaeota archaeon]
MGFEFYSEINDSSFILPRFEQLGKPAVELYLGCGYLDVVHAGLRALSDGTLERKMIIGFDYDQSNVQETAEIILFQHPDLADRCFAIDEDILAMSDRTEHILGTLSTYAAIQAISMYFPHHYLTHTSFTDLKDMKNRKNVYSFASRFLMHGGKFNIISEADITIITDGIKRYDFKNPKVSIPTQEEVIELTNSQYYLSWIDEREKSSFYRNSIANTRSITAEKR